MLPTSTCKGCLLYGVSLFGDLPLKRFKFRSIDIGNVVHSRFCFRILSKSTACHPSKSTSVPWTTTVQITTTFCVANNNRAKQCWQAYALSNVDQVTRNFNREHVPSTDKQRNSYGPIIITNECTLVDMPYSLLEAAREADRGHVAYRTTRCWPDIRIRFIPCRCLSRGGWPYCSRVVAYTETAVRVVVVRLQMWYADHEHRRALARRPHSTNRSGYFNVLLSRIRCRQLALLTRSGPECAEKHSARKTWSRMLKFLVHTLVCMRVMNYATYP